MIAEIVHHNIKILMQTTNIFLGYRNLKQDLESETYSTSVMMRLQLPTTLQCMVRQSNVIQKMRFTSLETNKDSS